MGAPFGRDGSRSPGVGYRSGVWFLLLACGTPEPVLQAVEPPATVEEARDRRVAAELRASPENIDATYKKPEGVYIDVRYLGGRGYKAARAEVADQLGAVVEERVIDTGMEVQFERGTLRLDGDRIQMVEVPLPEPLRRSDALAALGFPPATTEYKALSLEFRLLNSWGFRRLRFFRAARNSEDIVKVQAWKYATSEE